MVFQIYFWFSKCEVMPSLFLCVCVCMCVCVCVHVCVISFMCMNIHMCTNIHMGMFVCVCVLRSCYYPRNLIFLTAIIVFCLLLLYKHVFMLKPSEMTQCNLSYDLDQGISAYSASLFFFNRRCHTLFASHCFWHSSTLTHVSPSWRDQSVGFFWFVADLHSVGHSQWWCFGIVFINNESAVANVGADVCAFLSLLTLVGCP